MFEGLMAAASGMSAQEQQLAAISNNLANASTTGYHAEQVAFSDLLYNEVDEAGTVTTAGAGAAAHTIGALEEPGPLQQTGRPFDLAIEGQGFFQLRRPNGQVVLTRDGAFSLDAKGRIVSDSGSLLDPPITIPPGVAPESVAISRNGAVEAGGKIIGRISLVTVPSPEALLAVGDGQYAASARSGATQPASAARIRQGALESSNVEVGNEMVAMIDTERSYQMGSSAVKVEGEMLAIANGLRG